MHLVFTGKEYCPVLTSGISNKESCYGPFAIFIGKPTMMRQVHPLLLLTALNCAVLMPGKLMGQRKSSIHQQAVLIDTHNDFPSNGVGNGQLFDSDLRGKTHSDLRRMKEGGVDIQIFSIFCGGEQVNPYAWAHREIDTVQAWVERNPEKMVWVKNSTDLGKAVKREKLGTMLGVEGGHMIENDLQKLDTLFHRGVRYMTLTWNNSTTWASSALDETTQPQSLKQLGLSEFGKSVVHRMNELGMIVDVSHVGEKTFWDVIEQTQKPIIASHSSAYAICPHRRNLKDDQLRAIARNGGVVHVNFYAGFIDSTYESRVGDFRKREKARTETLIRSGLKPDEAREKVSKEMEEEQKALRPGISVLLDHIDHIVKVAGIDHVGLGSDFDGIEAPPRDLDGAEDFPNITAGLLKRGYSEKAIRKILGENFIRVLKANEKR
jgi:membrane dipeptidase